MQQEDAASSSLLAVTCIGRTAPKWFAKQERRRMRPASPGICNVSQLAVELLKLRANIDIPHIPFSGAAPASQAALAGTTDIASDSIAA
jgi:tripartite-type tricarboxylate transporter receptor subunit TctC